MSITFPMWFIYLWAFAIVAGLIRSILHVKDFDRMPKQIADIMLPKLVDTLSETIGNNLAVSLNDKLNDEYIVVKKPVKKTKKEESKDA